MSERSIEILMDDSFKVRHYEQLKPQYISSLTALCLTKKVTCRIPRWVVDEETRSRETAQEATRN